MIEFLAVFLIQLKDFVKVFYKIGKANSILIKYGDVSRRLIGHVDLMPLVDQTDKRTAHGNDVVIGMGTENDCALGKGFCALRTMGVVGIRLSSRPSANSMLKLVEYFYVHLVG